MNLTVEELSGKISARPLQGTQLLQVSVIDSDYSRACRIADEFAGGLRDFSIISSEKIEVRSLLRTEIVGLESDIREARNSLTSLRESLAEGSEIDKGLQNQVINLENRLKTLRSDYLRFVNSLKSSERINILGAASGSSVPVSPSLWLNLIVAILGVQVFTVVVILLIEYPARNQSN